jgi:hypothetical protein
MRLRRSGKVERILAKARGIKVYCLENYFNGTLVRAENVSTCCLRMVDTYQVMRRSYVRQNEDGSFTFHVHSNLWYEFNSYVGQK